MTLDFWKASLVRRWHTNADLSHTCDPIGGHSARVALMALRLKPDLSRDALVAALTHDLGEYKVGDFPRPLKDLDPDLAQRLSETEARVVAEMGFNQCAKGDEAVLIKLCDGIDAYLWAKQHAPHIMGRKDWREMAWVLTNTAESMGVLDGVLEIMGIIK